MLDIHPDNLPIWLSAIRTLVDKGCGEEQIQALLTAPITGEVYAAIEERHRALASLALLTSAAAAGPHIDDAQADLHYYLCAQIFSMGWQAAMDYISIKELPSILDYIDDLSLDTEEE